MKLSIIAIGEEANGFEELNVDQLSAEDLEACREALNRTFKTLLVDPTKAWELSTRACNVLQNNELTTLKALQEISVESIYRLPKCGSSTLYEILAESRRQGCHLPNWEEAIRRSYRNELYNKLKFRKTDKKEVSIDNYDFGD